MTTPNYREQAEAWLEERGLNATGEDAQSMAWLLSRIAEERDAALRECVWALRRIRDGGEFSIDETSRISDALEAGARVSGGGAE